jgi:hypothetical protein
VTESDLQSKNAKMVTPTDGIRFAVEADRMFTF